MAKKKDLRTAQQRLQEIIQTVRPDYVPRSSNCWEVINCGQEDTCEAAKNHHGRRCYLYDHTFCFGEDMGTFEEKISICLNECPFYKALEPEIGGTWVEAHRQLANQRNGALQDITQILRRRADDLAHALMQEETADRVDLIVFQLGSESLALETKHVVEIRDVSEITPVPCTPDFVLGITNVRGQIFSVLDIRKYFGAEDTEVTETAAFLLVSHKGLDMCLLVDRIEQKNAVFRRDIKSATGSGASQSIAGVFFLNGVNVSLINWDTFVTQNNLTVNEEV